MRNRDLLALAVLLVACGKEVAPPATPSPEPPAPEDEPVDAPPPPPRAPRAPFAVLWSQQTRPDNRGLALSPDGTLAVLSPRELTLYDRRGAELASQPACAGVAGAIAFVKADRVALVCAGELRFYGAPDLAPRGVRTLPAEARAASFAGDVAAIAYAGEVRLYDVDPWSERRAIAVAEPVTAMSLSGERLALGLEDGSALLIPIGEGDIQLRVPIKPGLPTEALALSADGARLLAASGPLVGVWDAAGGRALQRFRTVGGVRDARWLGDDEIASIGRDGLVLLDVARGASAGVGGIAGGDTPVGLAAASPRRGAWMLCAAGADGFVSCYGRGIRAGQALPVTATGAADERRTSGTVVSSSGGKYEIRAHASAGLPPVGQHVVVLRYVEVRVAGARHGRWIEIADADVVGGAEGPERLVEIALRGALKNLELLGEARADPLGSRAPVKLVWHP